MPPKKMPKTLKPSPSVFTEQGRKLIDDWWEHGGGKALGKGSPVIQGDDPRNQADPGQEGTLEGEFGGFDREGNAIMKPAPQVGNPEIHLGHTGEPGDTSLIHSPVVGDTTGDLAESQPFSDEQVKMLLEEFYGNKGAGRNSTESELTKRKGPLITSLPPSSKGSLITSLLPIAPGAGALRGMSTGGALGVPRSPLVTTPRVDRKTILAAMARNQARANGHHLIA